MANQIKSHQYNILLLATKAFSMRLNKQIRLRSVFMLLLTLCTLQLSAQSDPTGKSAVTRTYAITNATVIQSPGQQMTGATVVIKDGLIQAVGTNASVPGDAQVIDGTDLYIYAAFIDGMSNTGAKRPKAMERPRNLFTPDPPNDFAGITPENSITSQLDIGSSSIESMRKAGFAVSHSVPYGRMLPGSGSLLLLTNAEHMDDLIMEKDVSLFAQFLGAPGAYPNNYLGMMAKWRNLYRNAVQDKQHVEMYEDNPSGLPRPTNDRVSQAFFPVIAKQKSVFFDVDAMLKIRRAMRLQDDLGFNLMVGGVEQAWELADEFKANNVAVFLSLDVPDKPKDSKDDDKSEEVAALEARRMEFYTKHVTQAKVLKDAGVSFGFSTKGTRASKVKDNVMVYIENGLSEDDALAALTTNPASILGISAMTGTVESGKMANLMVSTAPYFTKDSQVKMMFVDGEKFEYEVKKKKAKKKDDSAEEEKSDEAPATAAANDPLAGTWSFSFTTPGGEQNGKMIIKKEEDGYSGVLTSDDGSPDNDMDNISYRDGNLSFSFAVDAGGQSVEILVEGAVDGKNYNAEATVEAFNVTFELTATKDDNPQ